ncbi:hypothetical protein E4T56_gene9714, partial [Termitomyces sp. T112]
AMGYGALDAVDTPLLYASADAVGRHPLLAKIEAVGRLIEAGPGAPSPVGARRAVTSGHLVAIGDSAGGPAAPAAVLKKLPAQLPAGIVIVQHVDARFALGLAQWLNEQSPLSVRLAQEGDRVIPGQVLVAGTDEHLVFKSPDRLGYSSKPADHTYRPSIDVFFRSAGQFWAGGLTGLLLTGMGADGARGLKELRDKGHVTIAQDKASSAVYDSAPIDRAFRLAAFDERIFRMSLPVTDNPGSGGPVSSGTEPLAGQSIMVLLVDDQIMVGEAVRRALLTEAGIEFHYCSNPVDALAIARKVQPTVILQDLVLPSVNGLDL